ncbi:hypothetical protein [Pedobacter rhizosphaerae]|uniref:SPASM domain peptide maturase, grasp-with-spasm system n=1 Tax=Pedobacter rhizosphaerae TaxID=390241 RepID=A0A1H9S983_9SPHI|nr:hypothetical protein [Pedobacter rhizosphaerae]SER81478.1 hypothetical protein SAMN04488023_11728 [Pedobacter rhizosphaerae]
MTRLYLRNQLCIPVMGFNRAIIYDLGRKDYHFISEAHYHMLNTDGLINFDGISDESERSELIDFLLDLEIVFEVASAHEAERFPKISTALHHTNPLSHAVVHTNISRNFIDFISQNHLQNLSIISAQMNDEVIRVINSFAHLEIDGIYLYIEKFDPHSLSLYERELARLPAVFSVNFFKADKPHTKLEANIYYNFFTEGFGDYKQLLTVDKLYVNQDFFLEAYNKHSYYNGKIYIDPSGNIKNGLNNTQIFGNINSMSDDEFHQTINSELFLALGNISKQKTLVCQHCEFRYMCTDTRVPEKEAEHWFHHAECVYNPYISKWNNEEGYLNLKASGITVSASGCTINKDQLSETFNKIWSE